LLLINQLNQKVNNKKEQDRISKFEISASEERDYQEIHSEFEPYNNRQKNLFVAYPNLSKFIKKKT